MSTGPTLDSVCLFIVDCLHATAAVSASGYPLIRTPNIGRGRLQLEDVLRVNEEVYEQWTTRAMPQPGDLILAREAPAGNVAIIKNRENVCLGQRTVLLRPDPAKVDPDFLCYYLLADPQQGALLGSATGATAPHVNMKDIRGLPLRNLPRLENQQRIGATLCAYDDLIDNNQKRMKLLEEAARLLYQEWFVRLKFPGHEHTPIVNGVPQGWRRKVLGDICCQIRETVLPKDLEPDTPYIGLEHIPRRSISLTDWGAVATVTSAKHRYKAGDILFGKIRPYFHKVGIAFTDGVSSSDSIVIRAMPEELRSFVLMTVASDPFVAETSQSMREGSKMPRADWKLMTKYPVGLPPEPLMKSFGETITVVTDQLRNLCFQNRKLQEARDLLLPRLMSGEVAV